MRKQLNQTLLQQKIKPNKIPQSQNLMDIAKNKLKRMTGIINKKWKRKG